VVKPSAIVGFFDVLQQTPRAIIVAPPSEITFPPLLAVVKSNVVTKVSTVGMYGGVEKVKTSPNAVPAELIAYALT
jgi:hypothetical protein